MPYRSIKREKSGSVSGITGSSPDGWHPARPQYREGRQCQPGASMTNPSTRRMSLLPQAHINMLARYFHVDARSGGQGRLTAFARPNSAEPCIKNGWSTAANKPFGDQCRILSACCAVPLSAPLGRSQACVSASEQARKAQHRRRKPNRFDNEVTQTTPLKAVSKNQPRATVI